MCNLLGDVLFHVTESPGNAICYWPFLASIMASMAAALFAPGMQTVRDKVAWCRINVLVGVMYSTHSRQKVSLLRMQATRNELVHQACCVRIYTLACTLAFQTLAGNHSAVNHTTEISVLNFFDRDMRQNIKNWWCNGTIIRDLSVAPLLLSFSLFLFLSPFHSFSFSLPLSISYFSPGGCTVWWRINIELNTDGITKLNMSLLHTRTTSILVLLIPIEIMEITV